MFTLCARRLSKSMRKLIRNINHEFLETIGIHGPDDTNPALVGFYFNARRKEVSTAISAFNGYKLLLSPTSSQSLTDIVKRGLLLADLVVLNHPSLPTEPATNLFVVPSWFPRKKYSFEILRGNKIPPHLVLGGRAILAAGDQYKLADGSWDGVPAFSEMATLPNDIAHWCLNDGRHLLESGDVIYAPMLPPADWEQYLFTTGINFQSIYKTYRLLPQTDTYLNEHVAKAMFQIDLPLLQNIDLETLQKIKEDERPSFDKFRSYMTAAFNDLADAAGTENFERQLSRIAHEKIDPGIEEIRSIHRRINKLKITRFMNILFLSAPTLLSFYFNSPELKILGPTLTITGTVKEYLDHLSEKIKASSELHSHPLYMLWKAAGKPSKDNKV